MGSSSVLLKENEYLIQKNNTHVLEDISIPMVLQAEKQTSL